MAEDSSRHIPPASGARPRRRLWWFVATVLALGAVGLIMVDHWRTPKDEIMRRTAEVLSEARKEERSRGKLAAWAQSLPGPLAAVGDWFFPQSSRGAYEFSRELGELGSNTVPILIERLANDRSPMVREISATVIGEFAAAAALPTLTNALARDRSAEVREAVVGALGELRDVAALPVLMQAMRGDTNESVRASAVGVVAALGGPAVIPDLLAAGAQEQDWNVRASFARALAEAEEAQAIPLFVRWLGSAESGEDAPPARAQSSLRINSYSVAEIIEATGQIGGEPAFQLLTNHWSTSDEEVIRRALCEAFGALRDARAIPLLKEALAGDKSLRALAAEALGNLGDTNALPELLALVEDPNLGVRMNSFAALGRLGDAAAVPALIKALEQPENQQQRSEICEALGQIGDPATLEPILAVFSNLSKDREKVLWALGHLGQTNAIPTLASALSSPEREESFAAAYALAEIGGEAAAEALAANLAHKDEFARHAKACALAMLGRTNGLATVELSLRAREEWRRFGATLALARLGWPADAREWKPILADRDPTLRRLGQEAAAGRVVPGLEELLRSRERDFRQYAARGLLFFRDPATLPTLRVACQDRDREVRSAAELAVRFITRSEQREK